MNDFPNILKRWLGREEGVRPSYHKERDYRKEFTSV